MGGHGKHNKRSPNGRLATKNNPAGRNAAPGDRQKVFNKGKKGELTALPTKELHNAAQQMMNNVMKRRRRGEQYRPGGGGPAKVTVDDISNAKRRNNNNGGLRVGDAADGEDDDEDYETSGVRDATRFAVDAKQRQAYHMAAQASLEEARRNNNSVDGSGNNLSAELRERSLKKFFKNVKDVIEQSDVLLEVVDARDPMGCRLSAVEDMIENEFGGRKKVVLVVNKVDLLPAQHITQEHIREQQQQQQNRHDPFSSSGNGKQQQKQQQKEELKIPMVEWLRYFRETRDPRISEVCPFTCSSVHHAASVSTDGTEASSSVTAGINQEWCVSNLFQVLRRMATVEGSGGARKNIAVGVVGYPNVGKSSVINALRGKNVVGVGNTPGFTTGNTMVDLRKDIRIIDCPGVVMPGEDAADIVLRNAAKLEKLQDPLIVVARLLARCDPVALAMYYDVPIPTVDPSSSSSSMSEDSNNIRIMNAVIAFLKNVAWKRGRGVKQNGTVDEDEAARLVLKDWNDGRISYYSLPPEANTFSFSGVVGGKGLAGMASAPPGAGGGGVTMMNDFSVTSTVFGRTHLPRFFIRSDNSNESTLRVAWTHTDSMFQAAPGADAPICYNPMDNIDPVTGLPLDGGKKKKKQQQQQQNPSDSSSSQQQQQDPSAVARQFLDTLYGSSVSED